MVLQFLGALPNISLVRTRDEGMIDFVKIKQKLLFLASAMGFLSGAALGQAEQGALVFQFTADSVGNYRQGPTGTAFEGGTFAFNVLDGDFAWEPFNCNGPEYFPPGGPCPIGATGYVSRGLQNDPLLFGLGPYFSVVDIAPALLLQPFRPDSVVLISAPPSLLPRPLAGFNDRSLSVFFDLQTVFITQYDITSYNFERDYTAGERGRFDGEVVPGAYRYNFASIQSPARPIVLAINQFPALDGYRKINNTRQGLLFTGVTFDDGFATLDPNVINVISWQGNTTSYIAPSLDLAYFSIKQLTNPSDPLSDPDLTAIPLFPDFTGPTVTRVLLPSALDDSFTLAPNFLTAGETGVIDLEFEIFRPTTNVIFDNSIRRFRMPVKVLSVFTTSLSVALPPNSTTLERSADYDFDGDGIRNFTEWAFGSDPADAGSVPGIPVVTAPAPSNGIQKFSLAEQSSVLQYKVDKLKHSIPKLKYTIEYSADMNTWTEIKTGDPSWIVEETEGELKVTSKEPSPAEGGFFRAKAEAITGTLVAPKVRKYSTR
jgi:hypothetical protein